MARADSDSKLKTMRDTLYDGVSGCVSVPEMDTLCPKQRADVLVGSKSRAS